MIEKRWDKGAEVLRLLCRVFKTKIYIDFTGAHSNQRGRAQLAQITAKFGSVKMKPTSYLDFGHSQCIVKGDRNMRTIEMTF